MEPEPYAPNTQLAWAPLPALASGETATEAALKQAEQRLTKSAADWTAYTSTGSKWTRKTSFWTNGFMTGCWWRMHSLTGNASWKALAEKGTAELSSWQNKTTTHDVGFVIMCSYGLAGVSKNATVIKNAARSLAKRYVSKLKVIRSWGKIGDADVQVIIDNMMNLKLLFEAAKLPGGDPKWKSIAIDHATTSAKTFVRDNGSTFHKAVFTSGGKVTKGTHQGTADSSTWARGQAWALYGFAEAYAYTGNQLFKTTAERCAKYFLDKLPSDGVPYWDFDAPSNKRYKDTSAAAIAACGLFKLGQKDAARRILRSLISKYQAKPGQASLLCCGCANVPKNEGIGVGYVVSDYYFLEAIHLDRGGK